MKQSMIIDKLKDWKHHTSIDVINPRDPKPVIKESTS